MPRIPTYRQKVLPSTNVGAAPAPVSAANIATGAPYKGWEAIGQGLVEIGNVKNQIKQEQIRFNDAINTTKIEGERRSFEDNLNEELRTTPIEILDTNTGRTNHDNIAEQRLTDFDSVMSGYTLSANAQAMNQVKGQIWRADIESGVRSNQVARQQRDAQASLSFNLEDAVARKRSIFDVQDALANFNKYAPSVYGPQEAQVVQFKAVHDGLIRGIQTAAVQNAPDTTVMLQAELDARAKGGTTNEVLKKYVPDDADLYNLLVSTERKSATDKNRLYDETERGLHQKFIDGTLTKEENDNIFKQGLSDVSTHKAYDAIIQNKELLDTDSILAEKWLNGTLALDDIKQAQKEGRISGSNVVAAWKSRLGEGQFNIGIYDTALVKIREVQFDKGKYNETRQWLINNSKDLGAKWDDVRNKLETAMNAKGDAAGPHVRRAHSLVDKYVADNPTINDGTLESIKRVQEIHDAIDARAEHTPEQMRNLVQGLLLPYQEEEAKGWFSTLLSYPISGIPKIISASREATRERKLQKRVLLGQSFIQPESKEEFKTKLITMKQLFGENSPEARQFYDRYVDSYEW